MSRKKLKPALVQSDGRLVPADSDMTGEPRLYIKPGDPTHEIYRITTFVQYPPQVPVNTVRMARAGFYYLGLRDRVRCFCCQQEVDQWQAGDNPFGAEYHKEGCKLLTYEKTENESLNKLMGETKERYASGAHSSDPEEVVTKRKPKEVCANPHNAHMRNQEAREKTFGAPSSWPRAKVMATPADMADAGLFYLGQQDRVKCWYCNGGLQNWKMYDNPWFEHAKWYPTCEYVLAIKGPEFVARVTKLHPGIGKPTAQDRAKERRQAQLVKPKDIVEFPLPTSKVHIRVKDAQKNKREDRSPIVAVAQDMGFDKQEVYEAMVAYQKKNDGVCPSIAALIEMILELQKMARGAMTYGAMGPDKMIWGRTSRATEELRCAKLCKGCYDNSASVILMPCAHLALCQRCRQDWKKCPICEAMILDSWETWKV